MPAAWLVGEDAKTDLSGVPYKVSYFRVQPRRASVDVGNTEGVPGNPLAAVNDPGFEASISSRRGCTITIREPTLDLAANVFAAPTSLALGDYIPVKIYPNGRAGDYHYFPSARWTQIGHEGQVGQGQPVDFQLEADGPFFLYGEAKP